MPNHTKEEYIFQPNKNALNAWLRTRKDKKVSNGYTLPGFFGTHSSWDGFFTILSIIIELAIFAYFMSLVRLNSFTNWIALPIIILADLVFIFLVHQNKKSNVLYDNAIIFVDAKDNPLFGADAKTGTKELIAKELNVSFNNLISYLGISLEIASCFTKIYILSIVRPFSINPISIGIIMGYSIQTFFYITSAGYFFWEMITRSFIARQHNAFRLLRGYNATSKRILFNTDEIKLDEITDNETPFQLMFNLDKDQDNKHIGYILTCKGIPSDDDIIKFANKQKTIQAINTIISWSHYLQLSKFAEMPS